MVKKARRSISLLIIAALLLSATPVMAAAEPTPVMGKSKMHFVVDGVEYAPPEDAVGGFLYDGGRYTYVPLRFVANILKKDVGWDNNVKRASIFDPESPEDLARIEAYLDTLKLPESVIEPAEPAKVEYLDIQVVPEVSYAFNGKLVEPDAQTPGLLVEDRIYVPFRFITENLGYKVNWDKTTFTVSTEIAEVDRIVGHYRGLAEQLQAEFTDEALAILAELGFNNVFAFSLARLDDAQLEKLQEIAPPFMEQAETKKEELVSALKRELREQNQPILQAEWLEAELDGTLNLLKRELDKKGVAW